MNSQGHDMTQGASLLVDIGNSRIKWNLLPAGATHFSRQSQSVDWTLDSLNTVLDKHWGDIAESVQGVFIANVAGEDVQQSVATWCDKHWQCQPLFVSTSAQFGPVTNGYQDHRELGVDRWLAVIAAQHLYPQQAVIVLDCGTAITVDTLLPDGQHRAGPIIPGRKMALDSLIGNTAFANDLQDTDVPSLEVFVSNTKNAVLNGVNFATSKALSIVVKQIQQNLSEIGNQLPITVIATGGSVTDIMPFTSIQNYSTESDLVLKGLQLVSMGES